MVALKHLSTLLLLLSAAAPAQELPDAPQPKTQSPTAEALPPAAFQPAVARPLRPPGSRTEHRVVVLSLWTSIALRTADTVTTCHNFNFHFPPGIHVIRPAHEDFLPVHTCGGVAAWNAGTVAVAWGAGKLLHHWGHHKLESAPNWISAAGSAVGTGYSLANPPHIVTQ